MLVEYWLWRYEDPFTGATCKTATHMTASEAAALPRAQRIAGSVVFQDVEPDYSFKRLGRSPREKRAKGPVRSSSR